MRDLLKVFVAGTFYLLLFASCNSRPQEQLLLGSWQVDSVYSYYNGFVYWQRDEGPDWATYVYHPNGQMDEVKYDNPRHYKYFLSHDTIYWESLSQSGRGWYKVLALNPQKMVLKKEKAPMFGDHTEERYEIRYFSRLDK